MDTLLLNADVRIPSTPERYRGWEGWGEFLGTGNRKGGWLSFIDARNYVRSLGLKSKTEWTKFTKNNQIQKHGVPANPRMVYKNEWKSWKDWLGSLNISPHAHCYRTFVNSREYVRNLQLKSIAEWNMYCKSGKRPKDIPSHASRVYKTEWVDWSDWLGTGTVATYKRKYRNFVKARDYARSLKLSGKELWAKCKISNDVPRIPDRHYVDEWISWADWLGHEERQHDWLPFEKAREYIHSLGITDLKMWRNYCLGKITNLPLKPDNIPRQPSDVYKNKWSGLEDWLGNNRTVKKYTTEWILVATNLAKQHGGILPNQKWLYTNGYSGLTVQIRNHPELFSHIVQNKKQKTLEEWFEVAKNLVDANKGYLPAASWLNKNGYSALSKYLNLPQFLKLPRHKDNKKREYRHAIKSEKLVMS